MATGVTSAEVRDDEAKRALAYLRRRHCMSLATHGPEGLWAATVFYVNLKFDLYFLSEPNTRHARNIAASPQVAATISDDAADWLHVRGVQLEGRAELISDAERPEVLGEFVRRYAFVNELWWTPAMPKPERQLYRVRPSKLLFVDHGLRAARCTISLPHR